MDDVNGTELWRSDGTTAGTFQIKSIARGYASTAYPCSVNGIFYFVPTGSIGAGDIWRSDGTPNRTYLVKDITSNSSFSDANNLMNVNGVLYFLENSGPLWRSDGTEAGTTPVYSIPSSQLYVNSFIPANNKLFIAATTNELGRELWTLPITAPFICRSLQSGSWTTAGIWSCGHIPTLYDQVIINPSHIVTVSTSTAQAKKLTYIDNGKVQLTGGATKIFIK